MNILKRGTICKNSWIMVYKNFRNNKIERNNQVVFTELDEEVCLFNPEKGEYLNLNQTGSRIWNLLDKPTPIDQIIELLKKEFEGNTKNIESTTESFIQDGLGKEIFKLV